MKWVAIAGTWKLVNEQVESDVRASIKNILKEGNGIVTGGALGVDYIATDEVLKLDPKANRIKIFLPCTVARYAEHYRKRANEGVITAEQAELLISQLEHIQRVNSFAVIENGNTITIDKEAYFNRITLIIAESDELLAFHVNKSEGTQDTINKAEKKGIPVKTLSYTID